MGVVLSFFSARTALKPSRRVLVTAVLRIFAAGVVLSILALGFAVDWSGQGRNPFDYFGFFTNLTNLLAATTLALTGVVALAGHQSSRLLTLARAVATTCLLVVAIVYNTLVPGTGSAPGWVSVVLHIVYPAVVVLDWSLIRDHHRLRWAQLWWVLPYPFVWMSVVLLRGATDGWVPYGFLLPERGGLSLALHLVGLTALLLLAGALVWSWQRKRPERLRRH